MHSVLGGVLISGVFWYEELEGTQIKALPLLLRIVTMGRQGSIRITVLKVGGYIPSYCNKNGYFIEWVIKPNTCVDGVLRKAKRENVDFFCLWKAITEREISPPFPTHLPGNEPTIFMPF